MSIFTESQRETEEQKKKFRDYFAEKTQDEVQNLELAEFRADNGVYQDLNLKSYRPSLWGLIVFCKKEIYYYVAEQESYLSFFMKGAGKTEEKLVCLSQLSDISFSLPHKGPLAFLNPELSRSIEGCYTNMNGTKRYFTLVLNKKADEPFALLTNNAK